MKTVSTPIPKKRLTIRRYAVILNIVHIGVMR